MDYHNISVRAEHKEEGHKNSAAGSYLHIDRKPYKAKHSVHKTIYVGNQSLRAFPF